jgi:hypothetical protein
MDDKHDSARKRNNNSAAQRRSAYPRRRYRKRFDFGPTRRREIERHARHVGAADTDDLYRWLLAWCWHNPKATDLRWSLQNWSVTKLGRALTGAEVDAIVDDVENRRTRRRWSADNLGRWLGLAFEVRKALRITTIGSIDVNKRARKALRKKWDRAYQAAKRRARGVRPQSESLSATQPWRELGMSRRTWYRRNKERNGTVGTTSSAAIFVSCDDKTVPPTTKAAASPPAREFESLGGDIRMVALGLLSHAESAWDSLSRAA